MSSLNGVVVSGYEALRAEINKWNATGKKGRLVLLFLSDHIDGKGWCPDCVAEGTILWEIRPKRKGQRFPKSLSVERLNEYLGRGCALVAPVEPLVAEALADPTVAAAAEVTFVQTFVGQKEAWKDKTNSFRTSDDLLVNSIPTLLEYGKMERRLGDKECTSVQVVKDFILGL